MAHKIVLNYLWFFKGEKDLNQPKKNLSKYELKLNSKAHSDILNTLINIHRQNNL
jgi:hypothetical protein